MRVREFSGALEGAPTTGNDFGKRDYRSSARDT